MAPELASPYIDFRMYEVNVSRYWAYKCIQLQSAEIIMKENASLNTSRDRNERTTRYLATLASEFTAHVIIIYL